MYTPGKPIENDWYPMALPKNLDLGDDVYLDSAYSFAAFHSEKRPGLKLGNASGLYIRASLIVGSEGKVEIGDYTCVNGTYIICNDLICIGNHCLLSWGVVITDSSVGTHVTMEARRSTLKNAAGSPQRLLQPLGKPKPVVIEDNVWIGFDAIIEPGVKVGRGSVIGSKSRVTSDIPPYTVAVGSPARVVQDLPATDLS